MIERSINNIYLTCDDVSVVEPVYKLVEIVVVVVTPYRCLDGSGVVRCCM